MQRLTAPAPSASAMIMLTHVSQIPSLLGPNAKTMVRAAQLTSVTGLELADTLDKMCLARLSQTTVTMAFVKTLVGVAMCAPRDHYPMALSARTNPTHVPKTSASLVGVSTSCWRTVMVHVGELTHSTPAMICVVSKTPVRTAT